MNFIVEKNVAYPLPLRDKPRYPFATMKLGDSFSFSKEYATKIRSAAWAAGEKYNAKFSVRKEGFGFRVWRIK